MPLVISLYYARWCPHCKSMWPIWENKINEKNKTKINNVSILFKMIEESNFDRINDRKHLEQLEGFPSVFIDYKDKMHKMPHNVPRNESGIMAYLNNFLNSFDVNKMSVKINIDKNNPKSYEKSYGELLELVNYYDNVNNVNVKYDVNGTTGKPHLAVMYCGKSNIYDGELTLDKILAFIKQVTKNSCI